MFGAWSWAFLYWIFFGAVGVFIVLGLKAWFEDRGVTMTWWKWTILALFYALALVMYAAPFTIMGEGEGSAGWKMLAFDMVIVIILGVGVYRLMLIERKKDDSVAAVEEAVAAE